MVSFLNTGIKCKHLLRDICTVGAILFLQGVTLRELHLQESHQSKSSQRQETFSAQGKPYEQLCCGCLHRNFRGGNFREKL